jgi:hypothetical protein
MASRAAGWQTTSSNLQASLPRMACDSWIPCFKRVQTSAVVCSCTSSTYRTGPPRCDTAAARRHDAHQRACMPQCPAALQQEGLHIQEARVKQAMLHAQRLPLRCCLAFSSNSLLLSCTPHVCSDWLCCSSTAMHDHRRSFHGCLRLEEHVDWLCVLRPSRRQLAHKCE